MTLLLVGIGGTLGSMARDMSRRAALRPEARSAHMTAKLLELSQDLSIVIEIVDAPDKIEALMPDL